MAALQVDNSCQLLVSPRSQKQVSDAPFTNRSRLLDLKETLSVVNALVNKRLLDS